VRLTTVFDLIDRAAPVAMREFVVKNLVLISAALLLTSRLTLAARARSTV
jgi:hypothetical protein